MSSVKEQFWKKNLNANREYKSDITQILNDTISELANVLKSI